MSIRWLSDVHPMAIRCDLVWTAHDANLINFANLISKQALQYRMHPNWMLEWRLSRKYHSSHIWLKQCSIFTNKFKFQNERRDTNTFQCLDLRCMSVSGGWGEIGSYLFISTDDAFYRYFGLSILYFLELKNIFDMNADVYFTCQH